MKNWIVAAVVIVVSLALAGLAATAEGAPSAPSASLAGTMNPALTQTLQVTLSTQVYSTASPNSVLFPPPSFLYSASATNSQGGQAVLASNVHVTATVSNSSGSLYTLTASVSFTVAAICSGATCPGTPENLTITVSASTTTYLGTQFSPTSKIVFSDISAYQSVPKLMAPNSASFTLAILAPVTGILATVLFGIYAVRPNVWFLLPGVISLLVLASEFVIF